MAEYIEREAVCNDCKNLKICLDKSTCPVGRASAISSDSLRPKGHWIHCSGNSNLWHCSACGETIIYNPKRRTYNIEKKPVHEVNKFCRNCGADMRGNLNA